MSETPKYTIHELEKHIELARAFFKLLDTIDAKFDSIDRIKHLEKNPFNFHHDLAVFVVKLLRKEFRPVR